MKQSKVIFFALLICLVAYAQNCPQDCAYCEDGNCYSCKGDKKTDVYGGCHANTIDKCDYYGPSDQCFKCQPTYRLVDGKCEKYFSPCITEGDNNICYECAFGTTLDKNNCKGLLNCGKYSGDKCQKCSEGYTLSGTICKDNSAGCADVRPADGLCGKCKQGYFMSGYRCFQTKYKNDRCYILKDNQSCTLCQPVYNHVDGKCLLRNQIQVTQGVTTSTTTTSTTTTTTTSGTTSGTTAVDDGFGSGGFGGFGGFQSDFGANPQDSFSSPGGADMAVIQNCEVPDPVNGGCIVCVYGFFPNSMKCQKVSELCDGHDIQTGRCLNCKPGLTLDNGKCVDKFCSSSKDGKCQACQTGYKLNENAICIQFDPNCASSVNGRCDQCNPGFYVDLTGKCKQLPPNCAAANIQNGVCLECIKDFEILAPGAPCTKKVVIQNCQVVDPKNTGKCLICVFGYFPDGNKCSKVSQLCKDFNVQNGKCTSCFSPGLNLKDGKCIDANCNRFNGDICTACNNNFVYNKQEKVCKFNDPNCKNLSISDCLQCKPKFYRSSDKICKSLPINCQTATPSGSCTSCSADFQLINNNCIKKVNIPNCAKVDSANNRCLQCADRYFISGNNCQIVSSDCEGYNPNNGACLSCKPPKVIQSDGKCSVPPPVVNSAANNNVVINTQNSQASAQGGIQSGTTTTTASVANQPAGATNIRTAAQGSDPNCRQFNGIRCVRCSNRYYVGPQNRCIPVNPLCRQSNTAGQCTTCYPGYRVDSGKCIIAQASDSNCKTFSGQVCSECYQGYFYSQTQKICKKVNPLCKTSNPASGYCITCYPGYSINNQNGNCEVSFRDPNCKQFNPDTTCKTCSNRYYINANGKCSGVNPLCREYAPLTGACTTCYPGYGLTPTGQCQPGLTQDPNCKSFQGSTCRECVSGFYFSTDRKCRQASPLCKTFDPSNGNCLTCYNGYEISGATCIVAVSSDPNCKKVDGNNQCLVCYPGYVAIKGKCLDQNPLCKQIDMSTGGCNSCWQGYVLSNANCVLEKQLPINSDPYCIKMVDNTCVQCSGGYYFNTNQRLCTQLDPLCRNSDMANGDCTSCYPGYFLSAARCVAAQSIQIANCNIVGANGLCTECMEGTYLAANSQCKQVSILCASYDRRNGDCTSCIAGHFLQDGACVFPALFDQNCIRYESAYCSRCRQGFYISNYTCQPVDANCISFNYQTLNCESCANGMFPNGSTCQ